MNRREAAPPSHGAAMEAPAPRAMDRRAAREGLERALDLSREIKALADGGDVRQALQLDAERRALLVSIRPMLEPMAPTEAALLRQIAELNDHSIGRLEHRLRATCRDLDLVSVGRRALRAYGAHRP